MVILSWGKIASKIFFSSSDPSKKQRRPGVTVRLTPDSSAVISTRIAEISALECVDVETQWSDEYRGMGKLMVMFRERRSDRLLGLAKQKLSREECTELSQLLAARLIPSVRETDLTRKAISISRARTRSKPDPLGAEQMKLNL
jgi:hypothetical protein